MLRSNVFPLGALAAILASGCHKPRAVPVIQRDFPSFSLELPEGIDRPGDGNGWLRGRFEITSVRKPPFMVTVSWDRRAVDRASLETIARNFVSHIGPSATYHIAPHEGHDTIEVTNDGDSVMLTMLACGKRAVRLQTSAVDASAVAMHDRALRSFACHPDPARDDAPAPLAIALDLPGFAVTDDRPPYLTLTDGTSTFALVTTAPIANFDAMAAARAWLPQAGLPADFTLGHPHDDIIPIEGNGMAVAFLRYVTCPSAVTQLFGTAPDTTSFNRLVAVASSARCLQDGETPPTWPSAGK